MRMLARASLLVLLLSLGVSAVSAQEDPLQFPADSYTEETVTVTTSSGEVEVTYHLYAAITYVANPVDADYQSMNVKVPVAINGEAIDATNAPILFVIPVGGYMSASVSGASSGPMRGRPPGGGMGGPGGNTSGVSGSSDLALAAGYVVVEAGARGRDNQTADGTYYGKAPAAIVDLKAAVRYLHYNDAIMPGNADWIVSRGTSAGGALSALLGASSDSDLYDSYLEELGAADASDTIFAVAAYCPITDLENADIAYEWVFGSLSSDSELSQLLSASYSEYLATRSLEGADGYGTLTAENYATYLVEHYLSPSATSYLLALSEDERTAYLESNPWITWEDDTASFTLEDFAAHVGRKKSVTAFDALDLSAAENSLFGNATTEARHFTEFGAEQTGTALDDDIAALASLMNPMTFINAGSETMPEHWWLRVGSSDSDTSPTVLANLAIALENQGNSVDASYYWDAGHGADEDPEAFIAWIAEITGYTP